MNIIVIIIIGEFDVYLVYGLYLYGTLFTTSKHLEKFGFTAASSAVSATHKAKNDYFNLILSRIVTIFSPKFPVKAFVWCNGLPPRPSRYGH